MTTISFTGDVAFSKYFATGWQRDDLIDAAIVDFLASSDHVVANIEAPMTDGGFSGQAGTLTHVNPPQAMGWLKKINADIWTLANNHVMDCGAEGMADTLKYAREQGIQTIGAGFHEAEAARPVELAESGGIGIMSIVYYKDFLKAGPDTPGCITYDEPEKIASYIRDIKSRNRWCILVIHGGEEFASMPLPYVRKLYHQFLSYGADVIISHHSHTVQSYETVGSKVIFYSLGNFVFDTDYQRKQKHTEYGELVKLHITDQGITWDHLSTKVDRLAGRIVTCQPTPIFTDIPASQFRLLWPLGCWNYVQTDRIASIYFNPYKKDFNAIQWIRNDINWFGKDIAMELLRGRILYRLGYWRLADPVLVKYLQE
ncbi:MAG: CapA family protein [Firmicutes bacterium]|nr:CapA family protein [Bacillota bacterium]